MARVGSRVVQHACSAVRTAPSVTLQRRMDQGGERLLKGVKSLGTNIDSTLRRCSARQETARRAGANAAGSGRRPSRVERVLPRRTARCFIRRRRDANDATLPASCGPRSSAVRRTTSRRSIGRRMPIVLLNHPGITVAEHLHGNDYDSRAVRADARQPDTRLEVFPAAWAGGNVASGLNRKGRPETAATARSARSIPSAWIASGADELGLALLEEGAAPFDIVPARKAGGDQLLAAREVARGRVLQHLADHRLDRADRERRVGGDRARVLGDVGREPRRPPPPG